MATNAPTTRPKAPIENKITEENGKVTADWAMFFETAGDTSAKGPVLVDTHANRINANPNVLPYYGPGKFLRYLFYEQDTGHLFISVAVSGVATWVMIL